MKLARTISVRTRKAVTINDSTSEKPGRREDVWGAGGATHVLHTHYDKTQPRYHPSPAITKRYKRLFHQANHVFRLRPSIDGSLGTHPLAGVELRHL